MRGTIRKRVEAVQRFGKRLVSKSQLPERLGHPESETTRSVEDWPELLESWGEAKFCSSAECVARGRRILAYWEAWATCCRRDGVRAPCTLPYSVFEQGRSRLKTGKMPGIDGVPAELLAVLDEGTMHQIYCSFVDRLEGRYVEEVENWSLQLACGIWKRKGQKSDLSKYRWVSLVCGLAKWFEFCLCWVVEREVGCLPHWMYGFRKSAQSMDVTFAIVSWVRKAWEWRKPFWVASLDIRSAFDELDVGRMLDKLHARSASPATTAAVAREFLLQKVLLSVGGVHASCPAAMGRGARQGGAATPFLFAQDLVPILDPPAAKMAGSAFPVVG